LQITIGIVDVLRVDKSGAKVTAVQTLREFRRQLNFAQRLGLRQPSGALVSFIKLVTSKPSLPGRKRHPIQSQNNAGHHIMTQIGLAPETG
jgi:hypothetical protein